MHYDVEEKEEQTIARHFRVLRVDIFYIVQLQHYWNYEDVCKLALKVEKELKSKKTTNTWSGREIADFFGSSGDNGSFKPATPVAALVTTKPAPFVEANKKSRQLARCFKCHGFRHMQADWPNRQMVTFVREDCAPVFDESKDETAESDEVTEFV